MRVALTWYEQYLASLVGLLRHVRAVRDGREDSAGLTKNGGAGLALHVEGAMGEMAYAKATGQYWAGTIDTFKNGADVGRVQIRTRSQPDYELLVRPNDRDCDLFVLVRGSAGTYDVVGSILGKNAKRPEWSRTHGGRPAAFFVPDTALEPLV